MSRHVRYQTHNQRKISQQMKFALKGLKLHVMTVAVLMVTFSELFLWLAQRVQCTWADREGNKQQNTLSMLLCLVKLHVPSI